MIADEDGTKITVEEEGGTTTDDDDDIVSIIVEDDGTTMIDEDDEDGLSIIDEDDGTTMIDENDGTTTEDDVKELDSIDEETELTGSTVVVDELEEKVEEVKTKDDEVDSVDSIEETTELEDGIMEVDDGVTDEEVDDDDNNDEEVAGEDDVEEEEETTLITEDVELDDFSHSEHLMVEVTVESIGSKVVVSNVEELEVVGDGTSTSTVIVLSPEEYGAVVVVV